MLFLIIINRREKPKMSNLLKEIAKRGIKTKLFENDRNRVSTAKRGDISDEFQNFKISLLFRLDGCERVIDAYFENKEKMLFHQFRSVSPNSCDQLVALKRNAKINIEDIDLSNKTYQELRSELAKRKNFELTMNNNSDYKMNHIMIVRGVITEAGNLQTMHDVISLRCQLSKFCDWTAIPQLKAELIESITKIGEFIEIFDSPENASHENVNGNQGMI